MRVMRAVRSHSGSSWLTTTRRGLALTTLCYASLAAASVVAAEDYGDRYPAIPPGEERLIAAMLGRARLVRDCRLISGGVEYTVIKAIYDCPRGQVTLELGHLLNATEESIQTAQFAITIQSGSPPPGFQEALLSLIRSRETHFVWTWPSADAPFEDATGDDAAE
jgi:hypothetical protein